MKKFKKWLLNLLEKYDYETVSAYTKTVNKNENNQTRV